MQLQLTKIQHARFQTLRKKSTWRYPAKYPDKFNKAREMLQDGIGMNWICDEIHISYEALKRIQDEYTD